MSFRFWRRVRIAPGISLNLSKSGASVSFGPRGAKFTIGPRGKRATVGLPGTGFFYTTTFPNRRGTRRQASEGLGKAITVDDSASSVPTVRPEDRLTLGFFKRLITPKGEEAFVDGCRELALGNEDKALKYLEKAVHLADGAYLAGFLSLKRLRLKQAEEYLTAAASKKTRLGRYFSKYGISPLITVPITDEVCAHVSANLRGVLLGLVEVHQRQKRWREAIACLEKLMRLEPHDVLVKLSLAELLLTAYPNDKKVCRKVVHLAEGVANESPIHTALLLYKAKALRELGLLDAARETLTYALRRKKDRPEELLRALRYERALVYEALGQQRRARSELEKIYAEDPNYKDVEERLGL